MDEPEQQAGPLEESVEPELFADKRVLSVLFNTRKPTWKYVLLAGLIGLVPSLLISFIVVWVGLGNEETLPQFGQETGPVVLFVSVVIFSPVVETLALGFTLWLLAFLTRRPLSQAVVACVFWALLHSLVAPAWGVVVIWPFFVFSCVYLAWRRKSWWRAMVMTCGVHMFQNLLPGVLIAVT